MKDQPERFVGIDEIAAHLAVSPKTVRRHCARIEGALPHYRFMGKLKFKLSEVEQWAALTRNRRVGTRPGRKLKGVDSPIPPGYDDAALRTGVLDGVGRR